MQGLFYCDILFEIGTHMTKAETMQPTSLGPSYMCDKLKMKGKLEYELGELNGYYFLHITGNTESGSVNKTWRSAQAIDKVVSGRSDLTGAFLNRALEYKSLNTGGFVLAVLKSLGLVRKISAQKYEHVPQTNFKSVVEKKLEESKTKPLE
jgi:hypothetical protein